ncbi:hypothetical protein LX32DRAFT_407034 [Colletotrichum zoysiae]|uniref:Heterokaryon incompatibility domain-containing protein n=1 Tax=Colletotrichum zoysiae TaxID=1216348 RepID=A0AAD9HG67_9PEZI|nr:hypothetical protein LX32DRAFT_407034 [Colletotrichum zoysiae]
MSVCGFCRRTVLESNKTWGYHHVNAAEFDAAAKSGCVFCRNLAASVVNLNDSDDADAFYCWSMRETAQIRETKSNISITFRPVPGRVQELPEVCFDMFSEDELGPIPNGNMESFGLRTDSEASQAQMRIWLEDCVANHPGKLWERSVHTYTLCRLTNLSDKDDAIWGIAKLMRDILRQQYAHGLWSTCLEEQLAWRVVGRPKVTEPKEKPFPHWSWTYLDVPIQVIPRFRDQPRFYVATNHEGGKLSFEFEKPYLGWLKTEDLPGAEEQPQLENVATQPIGAENNYGNTQMGNAWKPDERSKLKSERLPIQAHICQGTLWFVDDKERWVVDIEGVGGDAVIEAFPDTQPLQNETPCEFIVLAASRVLLDELGREMVENDEKEEIMDVQYSGVGILVRRKDDDQLERFGAVEFLQICWDEWSYFRLACSETFAADDLQAENGMKMWLV